jgi:hypothetical protein
MDRAGRRPILLTGAVAMAIALTATGWWIYIDQAITPNAGMSVRYGAFCRSTDMLSRDLRHRVQCGIRDELGAGAMVR